jgi:hypothetical protein
MLSQVCLELAARVSFNSVKEIHRNWIKASSGDCSAAKKQVEQRDRWLRLIADLTSGSPLQANECLEEVVFAASGWKSDLSDEDIWRNFRNSISRPAGDTFRCRKLATSIEPIPTKCIHRFTARYMDYTS